MKFYIIINIDIFITMEHFLNCQWTKFQSRENLYGSKNYNIQNIRIIKNRFFNTTSA